MSKTLLITLNATEENGQKVGDQISSIKVAYLFVQEVKPAKVIMSMSPQNRLHTYWQKFLDAHNVEIVYDAWNPGDWPTRWEHWDRWRKDRSIEGRKFDHYREITRRIDGGNRQRVLCGGENGLGRKNIFEYLFYGQENFSLGCANIDVPGIDRFGADLIYHKPMPSDLGIYIAPYACCQRNDVFTMEPGGFWPQVIHRVVDAGISVTVGYNGAMCEELAGHPLYAKYYGDNFDDLRDTICRHKLVACGNTGIGWLAAACGKKLLAMQHVGSQMPDYHYEKCGLASLVDAPPDWQSQEDAESRFPIVADRRKELIRQPDAPYVAQRIIDEVNAVTVMTTGCYDVLHAGHVRHLEESRALGTRLVVALNSDSSVKRLKGDARPINSQKDRETVLLAMRAVDAVRIFDGDTAEDLLAEVRPDVLTNGNGYTPDRVVGKSLVESYGGRVHITCTGDDATKELSTTRTLARVKAKPYQNVYGLVTEASRISECMPLAKLKLLAEQFQPILSLEGSIADLGSYRGACAFVLRRLAPQKRLHLFDTWAGNPHDDDLCHHKKGEWRASLAECRDLVGDDERTIYHEGIFPETAQSLDGEQFAFACVDMDTYQATLDAINFFWPRLVPGGRLYVDDYGWEPCAGVKKAVDEKFSNGEVVCFPMQFACMAVKS